MANKVYEYDPTTDKQSEEVKATLRSVRSKRDCFSWGGGEEKESILDRYNRIQHEVKAFQQKLEAIKQHEAEKRAAAIAIAAGSDFSGDLKEVREALGQNEGWQSSKTILTRAQGASKSAAKGVSYAIHYNSASSPLLPADRHLSKLETAVGTTSLNSLFDRLLNLLHRTELLTEHKFETLLKRAQNLATEFETLEIPETQDAAEAKSKAEQDQVKRENNEALYELHQRVSPLVANVPQIMNRLNSQQDAHKDAYAILKRVHALRQKQDAVNAILKRDTAALCMIQKSFVSNLALMKKNADMLKSKAK